MCRIITFATAIFLIFAAGMSNGWAAEKERQTLFDMLNGKPVTEDMFSETFLQHISVSNVQKILSQIRSTAGAPVKVEEAGERYLVKTSTHEIPAAIVFDANDKIAGLHFQAAVKAGQTIPDILKEIQELKGDAAYLVTQGDATLHTHNADIPMAVGSAFKLAILAELAEKIARGEADWADTVTLKASQISAPTGILQTLPTGSPLTLHTLAAFMISISDNTATDTLLDFVGRDAVAAKLGTDFVLKTRELFILEANDQLRQRYLSANKEEKSKLIDEMATHPVPNPGEWQTRPYVEGVEFYSSLQTLCALIAKVSKLDIMSINPGFIKPEDGQRVAYKGGSEVGVLNLTTEFTDKDGVRSCIAMTLNAREALDETKAQSLYASLTRLITNGGLQK